MSTPPTRRPTLRDVASLAGVSFKSVSRVVNDEPGVSPQLAARVRAAIADLGYRPDPAASSLRRRDGRTGTIAVVLDDVANPFSAALQRGVEDAAFARGVLVLAASSDDDSERESEALAAFVDRRVDGIVLMSAAGIFEHGPDAPPLVAVDRSAHRAAGRPAREPPMVAVDRPAPSRDIDTILADNRDGARRATEHLLQSGHERVAFLGDSLQIYTARERLSGYEDAIRGAGLEALVRHGLRDAEDARRALLGLLDDAAPPTAVFAARNTSAVGAYRALRERRLQHEIALIGFDEIELADLVEPGISVVSQSPVILGRRAAEQLFARIDGDRSPIRHLVVPTRLITRGSGELPPVSVAG